MARRQKSKRLQTYALWAGFASTLSIFLQIIVAVQK